MIKEQEAIHFDSRYRIVDDVDDIHKLLLHLLGKLHDICEANGLVYNLANGTMLGAVRHGNFIPWDDDADVSMPRPDYEKFIKLIRENYSDYSILSCGDPGYPQPYAKFGFGETVLFEHSYREKYARSFLFVDIFPIDGIPENPADQEKHIKQVIMRKKKRTLCAAKPTVSPVLYKKPGSYLKTGYAAVLSCCPGIRYFLRKEAEAACQYPYTESSTVFSPFHYAAKTIMTRKEYLDRRLYPFDRYSFWGVQDYDSYLKKLYGNYMKYPPLEEQAPKHDYSLYVSKELYARIITDNRALK